MSISDPARHLRDMRRVIDGLEEGARSHGRGSTPWKALAREIGFAFGALRHYWVGTPSHERRLILSMTYPLTAAWPYLPYFGLRNLLNYVRLIVSMARGG